MVAHLLGAGQLGDQVGDAVLLGNDTSRSKALSQQPQVVLLRLVCQGDDPAEQDHHPL